jgi:hypothetical protein
VPATGEDMAAVHSVVSDAVGILDWSGGGDSYLEDDETGERAPVVTSGLRDRYRAAVDQAREEAFDLALSTLRGENPAFPRSSVLAVLELVGWTGALRDFKLEVLDYNGRPEVTAVTQGGRTGGGGIRRRLFRGFLGALNAALDSLSGLPGVGAIKELKDFLERALS